MVLSPPPPSPPPPGGSLGQGQLETARVSGSLPPTPHPPPPRHWPSSSPAVFEAALAVDRVGLCSRLHHRPRPAGEPHSQRFLENKGTGHLPETLFQEQQPLKKPSRCQAAPCTWRAVHELVTVVRTASPMPRGSRCQAWKAALVRTERTCASLQRAGVGEMRVHCKLGDIRGDSGEIPRGPPEPSS